MMEVAQKRDISLKIFYINCKLRRVADTEYRLIAQIIKEFGTIIPPTGLPTDEVYNIFLKILEDKEINLLLILDEIDQLVKKAGDEIIYNMTLMININIRYIRLNNLFSIVIPMEFLFRNLLSFLDIYHIKLSDFIL